MSVFAGLQERLEELARFRDEGILSGDACHKVEKSVLEELVITDTIKYVCPPKLKKIRQASIAPLVGEAIRRVTNEESVSSLFQ